ncbi:uncharacterized protein JNUCC1_03702 [Lentibacillus sp. JNUCC-1]|uniref:isoprenylcysteine carboxyl methyltransferase family protein n=1 Tax=Lentibacillus sp. JNUCC-1 TaxID=2654513 RepID=UPI0012E8C192|nr:isoprenylcysteine carboxylmethyltransferase family protein [Lentibacillus sp. JNUCC-1]MUV39818.1 uncharacterized protein [Lentibacillus sp. JNUCC-1]
MAGWMWIFIGFLSVQRGLELVIAKQNERWMLQQGAVERGQRHYKLFIAVHILFFIALIAETSWRNDQAMTLNLVLFTLFIIVQLLRVWCITALGRFWNTKIIVLPGVSLIQKGPYKYVKHPNYIVVALEFIIIPLLFGAYYTAFLFPMLHFLLLKVRIPQEERALTTAK